jgi:hypothetical protein
MDNKQVQVNIRLAEESADRLKGLAEQAGLKLGAFVERLITAYSADSNLLQNDSSAGSWESGIEELRGMIADQDVRLNALEVAIMSGLGGREGKVRVIVKAADLESVEAKNDSPSHPADSLPLPPQEFNQDKDQFRAAAVELYQQGETNSAEILRILTKQGYRNLEGKGYYRNDVAVAIKKARTAGLVE